MIKNQRGQIVVEYVLLLIVTVALASLIVAQIAKRDPDNPGLVVGRWHQLLQFIGSDLPEK